jgi:FAD/FMN-containing dehydrogenase
MPPPFNGIFRSDPDTRAAYAEGAGIFRIVPAGVAVPSTTTALRQVVQWAASENLSLIPRGAGSGMAGGNVGEGVILDLTVLDGCPLIVDPGARRARTGAAVTLRDLQTDAARFGLRLPPDPSSARFATLGGMVSTNAAGPASVASGSVRRWVESLDLVTADGELVRLRRGVPPEPAGAVERFRREAEPGLRQAEAVIRSRMPATRKNSSGYALDAWLASGDLLDLVIGSEGTLGVVTEIEWRLEPIPPLRGGVRAGVPDLEALGNAIPRLLELAPSALEFLDATFLRFVQAAGVPTSPDWDGLVMVEFEGDRRDQVEARIAAAASLLGALGGAVQQAAEPRALAELWDIRHAASPLLASMGDDRRSLQVIEDACVPVACLADYVRAVRTAGARHGVELVIFGHLGDGNVHVNLQPDLASPGWEERVAAIFDEVSDVVLRLGGTLSGEHGDGRLRTPVLERAYGIELVELFRLVKHAFDPQGLFNPGVKAPLPNQPVLRPLKVGAGAPPLREGIARALREIERNAAYAVSRLELAVIRDP